MADYSPNPSSPAQFQEVLDQNSPLNKYLEAQKAQMSLGLSQQQYNENALKAQYAPSDLYNMAMQSKIATIKGMKPFEAGLMDQMLNRIANPTQDFTKSASDRMKELDAARRGIAPTQLDPTKMQVTNPMDPSVVNPAKQLVNDSMQKGKPVLNTPSRAPQSIVMPQMQQQIDAMNAQAAAKQAGSGGGFSQIQAPPAPQQIGPQEMTRGPAQEAQPFGYNPAPSGINMGDPMAVAKYAQTVDPNQMLSSDLEKVFPATASAMAMSMRMLPSAAAGMANNASSELDKERDFQSKLKEMDLSRMDKQEQAQWMDMIKQSNDRMNNMIGAERIGTTTGKGGSKTAKDPQVAMDQKVMDKLNSDITAKQTNFDPSDKHDMRAFAKMTAPMIRNAYNAIKTPALKEQMKALHPDVDFGPVTGTPPAGGGSTNQVPPGMVQVKIKAGYPGAGTITNRPVGVFTSHPEIYEKQGP